MIRRGPPEVEREERLPDPLNLFDNGGKVSGQPLKFAAHRPSASKFLLEQMVSSFVGEGRRLRCIQQGPAHDPARNCEEPDSMTSHRCLFSPRGGKTGLEVLKIRADL